MQAKFSRFVEAELKDALMKLIAHRRTEVYFFIFPKEKNFFSYNEEEVEVFEVLLKYGGVKPDETICLDFSY